MSISGLSKSLLAAASAIVNEGNAKDVRYQHLLNDYGVTSPYELSEDQQNLFVVHAGKVLGEDFYGIQDLKKRIVWRGGISNLDEVTAAVDKLVLEGVGFSVLEKGIKGAGHLAGDLARDHEASVGNAFRQASKAVATGRNLLKKKV